MDIDYLVTGGAGFIGCAFSQALFDGVDNGARQSLVVADNLHPQIHPQRVRPDALHPLADIRVVDICDGAAWDSILGEVRPRIVIHLAAETGTGQSLDHPLRHTEVNVNGTASLIEALNRAGHIPEQVLLASSRAVYGEGAWRDPGDDSVFYPGTRTKADMDARQFKIMAPSGAVGIPLPHNASMTHPKPISVYGATKLAQEHLLSAWCASRSVPLSILRLQNVYGVGQAPHNPYTGIIGLFHRQAAGGQSINVYEDGDIGRDFVYIDDVVDAFLSAVRNPPTSARTIDVGSGAAITIGEAAAFIADHYMAPRPEISGAYRHGDVRWATCDRTALELSLGVVPKVDFGEGNRRISAWLRQTGVICS